MKQNILHKAVLFLMLLVAGNAYAGETKYYYSKVNVYASPTGAGTVYVASGSNAATENTANANSTSSSSSATHTYTLSCTANSGYEFEGWYSDANLTTKLEGTEVSVTASSSNKDNPTTKEYWAKFVAQSHFYNSNIAVHSLGNEKVGVTTDQAATASYAKDATAKIENTSVPEHTYYLQADPSVKGYFVGWFSDAECKNCLSALSTFAYEVTGVEGESTTINVYAKYQYYQLKNGGFEWWNSDLNEPTPGWNSFASAQGKFNSMAVQSPQPKRVEGVTGYAVELTSAKVMDIANANGNLTTGYVNMGAMSATDAANHNYTDVNAGGHYVMLKGLPDGVEFYSKFTAGKGNANNAGNAKFIIHDNYNYKDPEVEADVAHRIGKCEVSISPSTEWTKQTGAFAYDWDATAAAATDKYVLADFTTNVIPGGSAGDVLTVDDVRLIYNSEITAVKYDGSDVPLVDGSSYGVSMVGMIDAPYDETKLELTCNGRGATIEKQFDSTTYQLIVTVKGNDYEENAANIHVYGLQFSGVEEPATITDLTSPITINVDGNSLLSDNTPFKFIDKGTSKDLRMENFSLQGVPVGTLVVKNLTYADGKISTTQTVFFEDCEAGSLGESLNGVGGVPIVLDGTLDLDNKELKAVIDITMAALNQVIRVVVAPVTTISDTEMISTGLQNVKIDRTFVEGWNTVCLPFEWTSALLSDASEVQLFTGFDNNVITFAPTDDPIPANTPCLVLFNASNANPYYFGADVQDLTPKEVTFNGATFKGNYTPNYDMNGKYGVVINAGVSKIMKGTSGATINPGRAFFDIPDAANVREMAVSLEGHEGEATAIDGVKVVNADAPIYNLQGIKTNGKGHGVFIQNGKVIIK